MNNKKAFTLADFVLILITIGVFAAVISPFCVKNYKKYSVEKRFEEVYSTVYDAYRKIEADLEYVPKCYYWDINPYYTEECVEYSKEGECLRYAYPDGTKLKKDHNGPRIDCALVANQLKKDLNIVRICKKPAYPECIPEEMEGIDTIRKIENKFLSDYEITKATTGCKAFRKENIRHNSDVLIMSNGASIITYGDSVPIFAVDINGMEGPNKWGYDIYSFQLRSGEGNSISVTGGGCMIAEKGGRTTEQIIQDIEWIDY